MYRAAAAVDFAVRSSIFHTFPVGPFELAYGQGNLSSLLLLPHFQLPQES